jgi:hypothetical protein
MAKSLPKINQLPVPRLRATAAATQSRYRLTQNSRTKAYSDAVTRYPSRSRARMKPAVEAAI